MSNKAKAIFLDSNFTGEIKSVKIEGGNVIIDKTYEHIIDETVPIQIKGVMGSTPMYILKWDSLVPIQFKKESKIITSDEADKIIQDEGYIRIEPQQKKRTKGKLRRWMKERKQNPTPEITYTTKPTHYEYRKLQVIDLTDKYEKSKIQPSLLQETMDLRFLKNMKKYGVGSGGVTDKNKIIIASIASMVFGMVLFYVLLAFGI